MQIMQGDTCVYIMGEMNAAAIGHRPLIADYWRHFSWHAVIYTTAVIILHVLGVMGQCNHMHVLHV